MTTYAKWTKSVWYVQTLPREDGVGLDVSIMHLDDAETVYTFEAGDIATFISIVRVGTDVERDELRGYCDQIAEEYRARLPKPKVEPLPIQTLTAPVRKRRSLPEPPVVVDTPPTAEVAYDFPFSELT